MKNTLVEYARKFICVRGIIHLACFVVYFIGASCMWSVTSSNQPDPYGWMIFLAWFSPLLNGVSFVTNNQTWLVLNAGILFSAVVEILVRAEGYPYDDQVKRTPAAYIAGAVISLFCVFFSWLVVPTYDKNKLLARIKGNLVWTGVALGVFFFIFIGLCVLWSVSENPNLLEFSMPVLFTSILFLWCEITENISLLRSLCLFLSSYLMALSLYEALLPSSNDATIAGAVFTWVGLLAAIGLNLKALLEAGVGVLETDPVAEDYAPQKDELEGDTADFVGDGAYEKHDADEDYEQYGNPMVQVDQDYGDIDADEEI
eukprot:CAMPEP_0177648536 /NCGR_PEP_ID=MMETSP0447-20121125/10880_1 /TAXON_ID=0 /ORGANISM="Stygamoeba regulata, Strain BSH-02190019" /LENGTH=314 /DNA_ID=CAMNT_0019151183 /DNA_START=176 /DNA_END=1120 /DNA_ORIENTATION=+